MAEQTRVDAVVIGSGPGGYVAGIRLGQLGVKTIVVEGGSSGAVRTFLDHRIAMAFAIAGLRAAQPIEVLDCDHVATSFPGFEQLAAQAGLHIESGTG